jgi:arginine exporter protein ArgO
LAWLITALSLPPFFFSPDSRARQSGLDHLHRQGRHARRHGTCLGVIAADQVLMWLAVAGVAALLAAHPALSMRCNGWGGLSGLAGLAHAAAQPGDAPVLKSSRASISARVP